MLRKLLATTAVVTLISVPAFAETQTTAPAQNNTSVYMFDMNGLANAQMRGYLASNLIGKPVHVSSAEDAERVGEINDIVIGETGEVRAAIVGVGGFLGIGEKDVAVDFGRLTMVATDEDEFRVTTDATREELEAAPAYERPDYIPMGETMSSVRRDVTGAMDDAGTGVREEAAEIRQSLAETREDVRNEALNEGLSDRERWLADKTEIQQGAIDSERLIGATVYDVAWNDLGEVGEVVLTVDGQIEAAVIDVGGFLGIGAKPVAVAFESLRFFEDEGGTLYVAAPFTEEQLDQAASYDADTYQSERDSMLLIGMAR
ncbi:PRC-barrel domain-containing protein [Polymorphum gilvum]|uniref:PRC-barrel domain protein n=1 Tax=Polymorphum gilvum (strain LMG 25793 / CGMCC 1.9160 / SL003B-26A1) TaxID=991905 RepID=F2IYP4_POLGS|nr:PRC-barrel domain-containing protein [Polymorphum gilvum]ADZ69491.1 PRC-barrel domain protein [Polymorphum gilvum SL003B-26A1]